MDEVIYYNQLYDLYGQLLTEKQQEYFENYYFNNLSLSEMADNYGVSRNAIHKQLKIVIDKLEHYENILQLNDKFKKLELVLEKINNEQICKEIEEIFY